MKEKKGGDVYEDAQLVVFFVQVLLFLVLFLALGRTIFGSCMHLATLDVHGALRVA